MPQIGEVLMQGTLGYLLPQLEEIVDPDSREGYYAVYVPAGTRSLDENIFTAIIFAASFEADDWLPDFAREHDLEDYSDLGLMQDVIDNVRVQKQDPTIAELIAALNYFYKHDAFLDFGSDQTPSK